VKEGLVECVQAAEREQKIHPMDGFFFCVEEAAALALCDAEEAERAGGALLTMCMNCIA